MHARFGHPPRSRRQRRRLVALGYVVAVVLLVSILLAIWS